MKHERFPRAARIRSGREIRRILRNGSRCRVGPMDFFVTPARRVRPRVGFIVPRHGHSAVQRNLLRRRLREIARRDWLPAAQERRPRLDVLVRTRAEAYGPSFQQLRAFVLEATECECGC